MKGQNLILSVVIFLFGLQYSSAQPTDALWQKWVDERNHFNQPDSIITLGNIEFKKAEREHDSLKMAKVLNIQGLASYYQSQFENALNYYSGSFKICNALNHQVGKGYLYYNLGTVYYEFGNYSAAIDHYNKSLQIREGLGDKHGVAYPLAAMGLVYQNQGKLDKAIDYFMQGLDGFEAFDDKAGMAQVLNNIGLLYSEQKEYSKALEFYNRTLELCKDINHKYGIGYALSNIGVVHYYKQEYDKALTSYFKSVEVREEIGDVRGVAHTFIGIGKSYRQMGNVGQAIEYLKKAVDLALQSGSALSIRDAAEALHETYKRSGSHEKALEMFSLYVKMKDSILSEENQRKIIEMEYQHEYEKQSLADSLEYAKMEAVKISEIEKQQAKLKGQRIALASTAGGLILIIALALTFYRGKKRSDHLLLNILPSETAKELKRYGHAHARHFKQVTVLFTDFKDFTQITETLPPDKVVAALDECFSAFDDIVEKYGIEKIKTIGDAYMAAGGLPVPDSNNVEKAVKAALEMRDFILNYAKDKSKQGFEMRIGIHTGPVVAGIVGIKKFQYDIWGDTVNTAARMEMTGVEGKVNITGATHALVKDKFCFEHRGKVEAKNKGEIDMYFVDWKREGDLKAHDSNER